MSTSVSTSILQISAGLYGTGDDPVDSLLMRRGVANNLMHACDSMAQVRVNAWPTKVFGGNLDAYWTIDGPDFTAQWYPLGGMPFGPWPLTLRADGTPYRLIVQLAGATAAAGTVTFRVVIAPDYVSAVEGLTEDTDRVWEGSTTSTSAADVSGVSQGANSGLDYLDVSRTLAASWIRSHIAYDAVGGSSPVNVQQCLVSAWVFAKTTHTSAVPRLYGLRVAEYLAP